MPNDYFYDYANKCDCSEDDKCGCSFPNNLAHNFTCSTATSPAKEKNNAAKTPSRAVVSAPAPDFTAPAILHDNSLLPELNLYQYLDKAYGLLIFYPADFTYVCPTEILAYHKMLNSFNERDVKVLGISTDSVQTHLSWRATPLSKGGIGEIGFPLVADFNKTIAATYGVLNAEGLAMRASFLIDKSKIVRYQSVSDEKIGRNPTETLRIIDALQFTESNGTLCPAGWQVGQSGITQSLEDVARVLQSI